jgi:hypothetical protein
MTKAKYFSQSDVQARASSPDSKAAISGPKAYETYRKNNMSDAQRDALDRLMHRTKVPIKRKLQFRNDVIQQIIQYRLQKEHDFQERPAAVVEAMKKAVDAVKTYATALEQLPHYVLTSLEVPLTPDGWHDRAEKRSNSLKRRLSPIGVQRSRRACAPMRRTCTR